MDWVWDPRVQRYRDLTTGRFLSNANALDLVKGSLDVSGAVSDQMGQMVAENLVSPAHWKSAFREEIKREYIRQYELGIGGRAQMASRDWGSIGGMLKEQYSHLDKFEDQIAAGELTEAQITARSRMYTNSAREAYERAQGRVAEKQGMTEQLWVVNYALENCDDCLALEAQGWVSIGTYPNIPGDGRTQCKTNCGCSLEYR